MGVSGHIMEVMKPYAGSRRHLASSPFKPPAPQVVPTFVVDERVTHDKYGLGRVEEVSGVGESAMSLIDFGSAGRVKLMHNHAPVVKL